MLYDAHGEPEGATEAELLAAYAEELAAVVAEYGPDETAEATGLDEATVEAVAAGDVADIRLAEAATLLALLEDAPAEDLAFEVRDHLMMEMVTAILDVDTIAANIDQDLTGQEVQQALEGRARLTLAELASIHALVLERKR
ncbi:DUF5791 family protein [Halorarum halobium]|uniref:DUF5791 family protein n=1 Tax=Halorarum halobium TaxID=3075121 RepID=UPI0028AB2D37|nr:DUF5791 family protein [Halobaculum sp. XH14]